jgi:hypothetical protein
MLKGDTNTKSMDGKMDTITVRFSNNGQNTVSETIKAETATQSQEGFMNITITQPD